MPKEPIHLLPTPANALKTLGENLRLARLRRGVTAKLQAERAGISLVTLSKIEHGSPAVAMGNYMQVLAALGMAPSMAEVAADDPIGHRLVDAGLVSPHRQRAPRRKSE